MFEVAPYRPLLRPWGSASVRCSWRAAKSETERVLRLSLRLDAAVESSLSPPAFANTPCADQRFLGRCACEREARRETASVLGGRQAEICCQADCFLPARMLERQNRSPATAYVGRQQKSPAHPARDRPCRNCSASRRLLEADLADAPSNGRAGARHKAASFVRKNREARRRC